MEDEMWQELAEHSATGESEKKRSRSVNAQIWKMVQSCNTMEENLEHDLNEIAAKR